MKKSPWFDEYLAMVPVWNPGKQKEQFLKVPFLLPHELIHAFLSNIRALQAKPGTFGAHAKELQTSCSSCNGSVD